MRKNRFLTLFKFAPDDGSGGGLFSAADLGGDSSPPQAQTAPAVEPQQQQQQSTAQPEQTQAQTERLTPEKPPQSSDWKSSLPEELRDNPSLSKFKDVNSLAQSYVSTKALVGQNTVKLPSETSSPEDWSKFYTTLGRPDSPEGYEIKRAEQIPEEYRNSPDVEAFKQTFHELGLSAKQVNGIMSKYDEQLVASIENIGKQRAESVKQTVQKLRNDWGNDFENNIALADMAFNQLDTDGELEASGVKQHPAVVKLLAKIAPLIGGDSMIRNNLGSDQLSTVENDIANIRQSEAYTNEMHVDHSRTVQRMNMLQQQRSLLRRKSASV